MDPMVHVVSRSESLRVITPQLRFMICNLASKLFLVFGCSVLFPAAGRCFRVRELERTAGCRSPATNSSQARAGPRCWSHILPPEERESMRRIQHTRHNPDTQWKVSSPWGRRALTSCCGHPESNSSLMFDSKQSLKSEALLTEREAWRGW